jgi:hypothetical protein
VGGGGEYSNSGLIAPAAPPLSILTITIPVMATLPIQANIQAKSLPLAEKREQGISQNLKEQSATERIEYKASHDHLLFGFTKPLPSYD